MTNPETDSSQTSPEPDSSQTSISNASSDSGTSSTQEGSRVSKIRDYLGLLVDFSTAIQAISTIIIAILIPIFLFSFRDKIFLDYSCVQSTDPLEILAALVATVGLTVLGVTLAPAAILSVVIWLFIKFSYFCG